MPKTHVLLFKDTLTSSTASYTISNIDQGYTDLWITGRVRQTTNNNEIRIRFNSDTGSNYSYNYTNAAPAGARSIAGTYGLLVQNSNATSGYECPFEIRILDYATRYHWKPYMTQDADVYNGATSVISGLYLSDNAITSVTILPQSANLLSGCSFRVYGVKAVY